VLCLPPISLCGGRYPQLGFTKKIMDKVQQLLRASNLHPKQNPKPLHLKQFNPLNPHEVQQRPGVMQKFSETLQQQRAAKLRAKRGARHVADHCPYIFVPPAPPSPPCFSGEHEVFEVNTTNEIDWDELKRVGQDIEHENIIMLGSKAFSRLFFLSAPLLNILFQDTRSTFEKPPDALLVATLPDVVRSARSPQSKSPLH
jgi:hypothetical protein